MNNWTSVEHKIWHGLKESRPFLQGKKILVAVSGGCDSMVLLALLKRLQNSLQIDLAVAYVHHGVSENSYRDQAGLLVQKKCLELEVDFYFLGPAPKKLVSEEDLRDFRYSQLRQCAQQHQVGLIAMGHHSQDQLETRLIRLIRGTGIEGLEGMKSMDGDLWRPLLHISAAEIQAFAVSEKVDFLEDPSNQEVRYLRNWLRQDWLPRLESYREGALGSLAVSLQNIADASAGGRGYDFGGGLLWVDILTWSTEQKCQMLASYLHFLQIKGFRRGQIEEILKRLDNSQKVHSFRLAQCLWTIDANCVKAERL